jgi:hypothetical protein
VLYVTAFENHTILLVLPILAFAAGTAVIYHFGWSRFALKFVQGTLLGLQARPLTNRQFERTQGRMERGLTLNVEWAEFLPAA